MEVVVMLDIDGLKDEDSFIKYLKKEGLEYLKEEEGFVFVGTSSTTTMQTRAFILEIFSKALKEQPIKYCNMVFLIGQNPMESYRFDQNESFFVEVKG
jgi:hypothetical protein